MNCLKPQGVKGGSDIRVNRSIPALLAVSLMMPLLSCSYGFRGSLPEHLQSVRIEPFRSRVTQYGLEQEITSRVTEKVVMDGRLSVAVEGEDSLIEGTVAAYDKTPYSYTSAEVVEEYKLEIRVEVTFTDLLEEVEIIRGESITTWLVYDPDSESEAQALERLLDESADDIVRRCLSGW
jgi:outer membrane lipopolysaccharide assembly protein LptE/RlpB